MTSPQLDRRPQTGSTSKPTSKNSMETPDAHLLAPPSSSSTPPLWRGRSDAGPASTPSIAVSNERRRVSSASYGQTEELDVAELWRRTSGYGKNAGASGSGEERDGAKKTVGRSRRASSITSAALFPASSPARRRRRSTNDGPSLLCLGTSLLIGSFLLATVGLYIVLFSSSIPPQTGVGWFDWIGRDRYWKYLVPLQVTVGTVFVIVNWGSLKILRHSP